MSSPSLGPISGAPISGGPEVSFGIEDSDTAYLTARSGLARSGACRSGFIPKTQGATPGSAGGFYIWQVPGRAPVRPSTAWTLIR